ncbi:MAG TPA: hypothetical protein VGB59_00475 [Allosphingosinicella sp.]
MNDLATVTRKGLQQFIALPEGVEVEGRELRVHWQGRNLVLEPVAAEERIAPGTYTPGTLPPLSEGARKILATVDAGAPLVDVRSTDKSAAGPARGFVIEADGIGIDLSDEGLRGFDPEA